MSATPLSSGDDLDDATREQLYELARERGVAGRAAMTKDELREAVQRADAQRGSERTASRLDAFRRLAEARARGSS